MSYKVICINSKNRPPEIPIENWVEEGETYTVIHTANMSRQKMVLGYRLGEVSLPAVGDYQYYLGSRFRPLTEDDQKAEKAVKELLQETLERELELVPLEEEELRIW